MTKTQQLSEPLREHGFVAVDTDLPGDWVSNGEHSIQLSKEHPTRDDSPVIVARLYDEPLFEMDPVTVEEVAVSQSVDNVKAARLVVDEIPGETQS